MTALEVAHRWLTRAANLAGRVTLLYGGALGNTACQSDAQRVARQEAEAMIATFDRVQRADVGTRAALLDTLAAVPCTQGDICRFQAQCNTALRTLEEAQNNLVQVRQTLNRSAQGPETLAAQVIATERQIRMSQESAERCVDQRGALAQRYDVR